MRETFAIKVMTTDRSNLLTGGNFGMRMCYSITGVGASPGLRSCTHNLPAVPGLRPSSSTRSSSPTGTLSSRVFRCSFPRVSRCSGRSGGRVAWAAKCHRRAPQCGRNATLGLHSSGTAARLSGGRARTGATENLGSRRRLGGGTSVSEGSDAVGSVKGVHALGGNHSGDRFGNNSMSVAPERTIVPHCSGSWFRVLVQSPLFLVLTTI